MSFQRLLKDLEEVKSVIYEDTERAEELLDHVISEITIKAAQQGVRADFVCTRCKSSVHYYDGGGVAHCYFCEPQSR